MRGKLITFEGCEGSGKTTQVELIKNYLDENKIDYIYLREPGGTKISEKIRKIILDVENSEMSSQAEALLYASARAQLLVEKVIPALDSGKLVVIDRYIDSSFAYQAYARGLGMEFISKINSFAIDNCMPDMTIFLDISPKNAFERKGGEDKDDRLEQSGRDFHERVYQGYLSLSKIYKDRFVLIDSMRSIDEIHKDIVKNIKRLI